MAQCSGIFCTSRECFFRTCSRIKLVLSGWTWFSSSIVRHVGYRLSSMHSPPCIFGCIYFRCFIFHLQLSFMSASYLFVRFFLPPNLFTTRTSLLTMINRPWITPTLSTQSAYPFCNIADTNNNRYFPIFIFTRLFLLLLDYF